MAVDPGFLDHVTDLLSDLGPVQVKRMFGGVGLYQSDLMFALIFGDSLYLKADKETEAQFEAALAQNIQRRCALGYLIRVVDAEGSQHAGMPEMHAARAHGHRGEHHVGRR